MRRGRVKVHSAIALVQTSAADSLAWMRPDLLSRLGPFAALVGVVWVVWHPAWLGLSPGELRVQLAFGIPGAVAFFVAACLLQSALAGVRGTLKVPATAADVTLQAGYYLLNAPLEEAIFRGLVQGGLTVLFGPAAGIVAGTAAYVLYHRLGGWLWIDVLATSLVGVPVALAFWLLPGPPSLLGVTLVHVGATCGFLGPGPWLLRKLGAIQ